MFTRLCPLQTYCQQTCFLDEWFSFFLPGISKSCLCEKRHFEKSCLFCCHCRIFASPHLFLPSSSFAALSLVPEHAELSPWLSPVLVLPLLQLLSCSTLTEPLTEKRTHQLNLDLAHRLLRQVNKGTRRQQVALRLLLSFVPTVVVYFGDFLFNLHTLCKHLEFSDCVHFSPNAESLNQISCSSTVFQLKKKKVTLALHICK